MKKIIFVLVCFVLANVFLTGCAVKNNSQAIKYHRRLQKYLPSNTVTQTQRPAGTIDLSEGPKARYDANLGPNELNFDVKIKDPY